MASISKLAVILSANTSQMEQSLKKAHKSVEVFSHSFKEGLAIGAGVLGVDKIEMAIKKAIAQDELLQESADKVEHSFGQTFIHLTGMASWLPKLATMAENFAAALTPDNISEWFQTMKEKTASILLRTTLPAEDVQARVNLMREEFNEAVKIEKQQQKILWLENDRKRRAEERLQDVNQELEALNKGYDAKIDSLKSELDPDHEAKKLKKLEAEAGDFASKMRVFTARANIDILKGLEAEKKAREEQTKLLEEGKKLTEEYQTPMEHLVTLQTKLNQLFNAGAISAETYQRALEKAKVEIPGVNNLMGGIIGGGKGVREQELEFQKESRKLMEEQIPLGKKLNDTYERARDLFLQGKLSEEEYMARVREFQEGMEQFRPQRQELQFAGAATAGSAEAYSAILRAQSSQTPGKDPVDLAQKQLRENVEQTKLQRKLLDKQDNSQAVFIGKISINGG